LPFGKSALDGTPVVLLAHLEAECLAFLLSEPDVRFNTANGRLHLYYQN